MPIDDRHTPVMLDRCVELLAPALQTPGAVLVDATLGMGGHSAALLAACPGARLIGLDRDRQALALAGERLAAHRDRIELVHAVYDELPEVLDGLGVPAVQAILFDLGVSSLQLDEAERGFAYAQDAPLDMRMDQGEGRTAGDLLAEYSEAELRSIFQRYGEEPLAARYARAIVAQRSSGGPLRSTGELVAVLQAATPAARQRSGHPAKRVFQALRIEVNAELAVLGRAIPAALGRLALGGRIVVLAYHSLEDRLVKRALAEGAASTAPAGLPVELPEHAPRLRLLVRGAELAGAEEVAGNRRAAPVRLRAAERIREAA